MILYREDEVYWIYLGNTPYKRSSSEPSNTDIYDIQSKHPTSPVTVKREHRVIEEVKSFKPMQREDKYN